METQANYIEVVGTADFPEEIEKYVVELRIAARAVLGETAVSDAGNLRAEVVKKLEESGLRQEELIEGGRLLGLRGFGRKRSVKRRCIRS